MNRMIESLLPLYNLDFDAEIAARTALGEARGEGYTGMLAVIWSGVNRLRSDKWFSGHTLASVFLKPAQYSCWNHNDPNYPYVISIAPNIAALANQIIIARDIITGNMPHDPTYGSTHYKRVGAPATWAEDKTPAVIIGNHEFYNDIE